MTSSYYYNSDTTRNFGVTAQENDDEDYVFPWINPIMIPAVIDTMKFLLILLSKDEKSARIILKYMQKYLKSPLKVEKPE